jgi:hypothetical protein
MALKDRLARRDLPQATIQIVGVAFFDEPLVAPFVHSRLGDAKLGGELARREQAALAQPIVPA